MFSLLVSLPYVFVVEPSAVIRFATRRGWKLFEAGAFLSVARALTILVLAHINERVLLRKPCEYSSCQSKS